MLNIFVLYFPAVLNACGTAVHIDQHIDSDVDSCVTTGKLGQSWYQATANAYHIGRWRRGYDPFG